MKRNLIPLLLIGMELMGGCKSKPNTTWFTVKSPRNNGQVIFGYTGKYQTYEIIIVHDTLTLIGDGHKLLQTPIK